MNLPVLLLAASFALTLVLAWRLLPRLRVHAAHRRILAWSQDAWEVERFTGLTDFSIWLTTLDEGIFTDDVRLAVSASAASCEQPFGELTGALSRECAARLGRKLRASWQGHLAQEAHRRFRRHYAV